MTTKRDTAQAGTRADAALSLPAEIEALERRRILEAMAEASWVQSQAARRLGLTPRQLGYKLKKYEIRSGA